MNYYVSPMIGSGTAEDPFRPAAADLLNGIPDVSWSCQILHDGTALMCVDVLDIAQLSVLDVPTIAQKTEQEAADLLNSIGIEDAAALSANAQPNDAQVDPAPADQTV